MRLLRVAVAVLMIASFCGLPVGNGSSTQAQIGSNAENTVPINLGGIEGTVAASSSNACSLVETQYTIEIDGQNACGTTYYEILLDTTPDVKLYVRYGQRVAIADGQIVADYKDESTSPYKKVTLEPPYPGGTYYIAMSNCGATPASFTIRFAIAVVDYFGPFIREVSLKGKKLKVLGCYFDINAVILVNGVEQVSAYSEDGEMPILMARKAGKRISPGETVFIQVKNPTSGSMSQLFTFTRGAE